MKAYKLVRKMKDGQLSSLFIGCRDRLPSGEWLEAQNLPTKGFTVRPGWHCTAEPVAPHLSPKGRVWVLVDLEDFEEIKRPASQGGVWYLGKRMRIIKEI